MENGKAYVYILQNDRGNVLYVGSTENLKERIYFHKKRLISGFTKKYNVHQLVYFEEYSSFELVVDREKYLKNKTRSKKLKLIASKNPKFWDLTKEL